MRDGHLSARLVVARALGDARSWRHVGVGISFTYRYRRSADPQYPIKPDTPIRDGAHRREPQERQVDRDVMNSMMNKI